MQKKPKKMVLISILTCAAISTYTNIQIKETINKLLIYEPKAFSIVDTFGALNPLQIKRNLPNIRQ